MSHRLQHSRSRVRYAAPTAPPHGRARGRLERRRVLNAPFAPIPETPGSSAARGITIGMPFALVFWALLAWAVIKIING